MDNSTQLNQQFAQFQPPHQPESNFDEELQTSRETQSTIVAK